MDACEVKVDGYAPGQVSHRIGHLRGQGLIWTGTRGHKTKRHFTDEALAKAWETSRKTASAAAFQAATRVRRDWTRACQSSSRRA